MHIFFFFCFHLLFEWLVVVVTVAVAGIFWGGLFCFTLFQLLICSYLDPQVCWFFCDSPHHLTCGWLHVVRPGHHHTIHTSDKKGISFQCMLAHHISLENQLATKELIVIKKTDITLKYLKRFLVNLNNMKIEKVHSTFLPISYEQEWNRSQLKKTERCLYFWWFFFSIIWNCYFENLFSVKIVGMMFFLS